MRSMKQSYQQKMDAQLQEWQAKIDLLKAKAKKAEAVQKIKYYEQIETLRMKQQKVHEKLDKLRTASEGAWKEVKSGVEVAWHDLQKALDRATERFR